jgi:hypothetical protein
MSRYSDGLNGRGAVPGRGNRYFSTPQCLRALGPTRPPIQWVMGIWGFFRLDKGAGG